MYELWIAFVLFWFAMLCFLFHPLYLRTVRFEVADRCYTFSFMLTDDEWSRVKSGFRGNRLIDDDAVLAVRV